jgi:hypothetical protein
VGASARAAGRAAWRRADDAAQPRDLDARVASVNQAMGGTPWTYQEGPAASTITIYISFSPSSFNSVQVQQLVRNITPAHLDLAVAYNQGFVVGEGRVGEDRL